MPLRTGYKQTEVGVIPEDWDVEALGSCVVIKSGESPSLFRFESEGVPYFKVEQLNNNGKYLRDTPYHFRGTKTVPRGSLIFPKRGASILLNKIRILENDSFMDTNLMTLTPTSLVHQDFLYYALTHIELWRIADTTSIPQINNKHIIPLAVAFPPNKAEQEAIAEALSDADVLIESLEQLVTKKRHLKQGAMQDLLAGKKRLPGFSGEWEVKLLGDVADIDADNLGRATPPGYAFNYISLEDVDLGSLRSYSEQVFFSAPSRARRRLKAGDILVSTVRPNLQSHLLFASAESNWICSTGFSVVRCKTTDAVPGYVFLHFFGHLVIKQIETLLTGSNYPAINGRDVKALEIPMPTLPEQAAIAAILFDMDAEIADLESQLAKIRTLKQGMMHKLLTGKIRLI